MDGQSPFRLHTAEGIADFTAVDISIVRLCLVDNKSRKLFLIAHLILGTLPHLLLAAEPVRKEKIHQVNAQKGSGKEMI